MLSEPGHSAQPRSSHFVKWHCVCQGRIEADMQERRVRQQMKDDLWVCVWLYMPHAQLIWVHL